MISSIAQYLAYIAGSDFVVNFYEHCSATLWFLDGIDCI